MTRPVRKNAKRLVLIILGGWGVRPAGEDNVIASAKTPYFDNLVANYPAGVLSVSGQTRNERFLALRGNSPFLSDITEAGVHQAFVAETERAAFLIDTLRDKGAAVGQDLIAIVPSLAGGYEDNPGGRAKEIESRALEILKSSDYGFLAVDLSVLDLMLENRVFKSVAKSISRVDESLRRIGEAALENDWTMVITSYGGNAEKIRDLALDMEDNRLTSSPVPLIICGRALYGRSLQTADAPSGDLSALTPAGSLEDVGPAILDLMGLGKKESLVAGLL